MIEAYAFPWNVRNESSSTQPELCDVREFSFKTPFSRRNLDYCKLYFPIAASKFRDGFEILSSIADHLRLHGSRAKSILIASVSSHQRL
jgi:hypothetical protein